MDKNGCIGKDNTLPWRLKKDMEHFKRVTVGKTVVMGRKTWESIPKKFRPLPKRRNIVLTRDKDYVAEGAEVFNSVDDMLSIDHNLFIIGGAEVYNQFIEKADRMIVTHVDADIAGDVFLNVDWIWWRGTITTTQNSEIDAENEHLFYVSDYEKRIKGE
jgi:dihydrofolate reductase